MRVILLSLFFSLLALRIIHGFSLDGCNVTKSCWFHPPLCSENARNSCVSGVQWKYLSDGLLIQMEAQIADLDPTRPYWLAVGFSYNQRMNDDTVIECVQPLSNNGTHSISFNDEASNHVLPQASSVLLADGWTSLIDGILTCSVKYLPQNRHLVDENDRFKIHDLEKQPYYLLFARGNADTYTLKKDFHSTLDGPAFPWMTENQVCTNGLSLLFAWWVLGSSAILIARYFKPMFGQRKLFGSFVWFQLHRAIWIISLILQIFAVFFIFYQANWVWFECTYECSGDEGRNFQGRQESEFACFRLNMPVTADPKATIKLANGGEAKVVFKIRCSNNTEYRLKPVFGFIDAAGTADLTVTRTAGAAKDDKLVVEYGNAPDGATEPQAAFGGVAAKETVTIPVSATA